MVFVFEGCEGSGKTSIIKEVKKLLLEDGYKEEDIIVTKEPGADSGVNKEIRRIIFEYDMDPVTEAYLFAANRTQHIVDVINPNILSDKIVLCDRFIGSSLAYQGWSRGIGIEAVYNLNSYALRQISEYLDLITNIFVDVEPKEGLERIQKNKDREFNRLDKEELEFHENVYFGYKLVLDHYNTNYKIIKNEDLNVAAGAAYEIIKSTMNERFPAQS